MRRFISLDDTSYLDAESVNGLSLYAYCNNDPVNYADASGSSAIAILLKAAVSGIISATTNAIGQIVFDQATWDTIDFFLFNISNLIVGASYEEYFIRINAIIDCKCGIY